MFNKYYQDELTYLRELGREFATAYPAIAPMLAERGDPDTERLLEGVAFLPAGDHLGIVHRPRVAHVMHGADEVIPRMARGQFANPFLLAGQVIHFETKTDDQRGVLALRTTETFFQPPPECGLK